MKAQETFESFLKQRRLRLTQQSQSIFDVLLEKKHPLSASEVFDLLSIKVNLSTIHRTLDRFAEAGICVIIPLRDVTKYELGEEFIDHHHHFTCISCGAISPIKGCFWDTYCGEIEGQYGKVTSHTIEARGVCKKCQ